MRKDDFKISNKEIVIFDLDGTLALIEHRRHLVIGKDKDWDKFYKECVNDLPNEPVVKMAQELGKLGYRIVILSGRSNVVWDETMDWLAKHRVPCSVLIMREDKDYTPDDELKEKWLNTLSLIMPKGRIFCVFDDRDKVVDMWRKNGLTCFQVAEGDF